MFFFLYWYYLPLVKGRTIHLPCMVENDRKDDENLKNSQIWTTDNRQSESSLDLIIRSRMNLWTHSIIRFDKSSTRTMPYPTRLFSSDRHLNSNALWNIANLGSEFLKYFLDFYLLGLVEQKHFFKIHVLNIIIENSFQKM